MQGAQPDSKGKKDFKRSRILNTRSCLKEIPSLYLDLISPLNLKATTHSPRIFFIVKSWESLNYRVLTSISLYLLHKSLNEGGRLQERGKEIKAAGDFLDFS